MLLGIERTDTQSDRAVDLIGSQLHVNQGRALQSGPAGDVVIHIQHGAHIPAVHPLHVETKHRYADYLTD